MNDKENKQEQQKSKGAVGDQAGTPEGIGTCAGIWDKIIRVSQSIGSLDKSERNPHAKYNYVPIDDFYKEVARKANAIGLSWAVREVDCVTAGSTPTRNGNQPVFRFYYEFDMFDNEGNSVPSFSKLSILHPLQGPQTSGSAMSYAEKLMMRTTFKVVTGEKDADAVDPAVTNALNIRKAPAEWAEVADDIIKNIKACKSVGERGNVIRDNALNMALLKEQVPELYEKILDTAGPTAVASKPGGKKPVADIDF